MQSKYAILNKKRRYKGYLNGLSDLCMSQIQYNQLLNKIQKEKEIKEDDVPLFPEDRRSEVLVLIRQYKKNQDQLEWIKAEMMNIKSPNGREYICKIYNSNPYQDRKLTLIIDKKIPTENKLKSVTQQLIQTIHQIQKEIADEINNPRYIHRINTLDCFEKRLLVDYEVLGLSISETAIRNGCSQSKVRRDLEKILDKLIQQ